MGKNKGVHGLGVERRNCSSKGKGELQGRSAVLEGQLGTLGKLRSESMEAASKRLAGALEFRSRPAPVQDAAPGGEQTLAGDIWRPAG